MSNMKRSAAVVDQVNGVAAGATLGDSEAISMTGYAGMRIQLPSTSTATSLKVYGMLDGADEYALCQDGDQNDADLVITAGALLVDVTKYVYGVHTVKIVLNASATVYVALVS